MLRAPSLLLLALTFAVPAPAVADTKAEKAAKKKKAKKDKKKSKADKDKEKADLEAAEAEAAAAAAAAEAENAKPDAGADADALKTKEKVDAEAEAEKAEAEKGKEEAEKDKKPPEPVAAPSRGLGLTIARGRLVISGSTVNVNLSAGTVGKPISLAPSVWYGVTDKLSIGVTHDGGTTRWTPRPGVRVTTTDILGTIETEVSGAGICVTGTGDGNCPKPYDNVGADVLIGIADGGFSVAGHVGVDILSIDQLTIGARLGVLGAFAIASKISLVFDPRVQVGVTDRDSNGESLDIPLWVWFNASPKLGIYVHTGFAGPFDGLADSFNVPLGLGASIGAGERLTLGADFHFSNLLGKGSSADGRVLGVRVAVTL